MSFYEKLGVKRLINCYDTYTLIGGHILSEKVISAMNEAERNFTWMWELEEKVGKRIAQLTGAESAFVTPGVFAALAMCAASCMAGNHVKKMSQLPDTNGMRNEFIIQRVLRDFKYDRSMTVAGGKLVEVGDEHVGCTEEELESAITPKTAAFHYMAHGITGSFASKEANIVPLEKVIRIAHSHKLPVLVDAAYQCFPKDGFRRYTALGADAVAYSCKYFGGPNTAGILLGKKELVDVVALHSFVGQEGGPGGKLLLEAKTGVPHGSVFRGYKMDRSSIVGAVASLEEHLATDYEEIFKKAGRKVEYLKEALKDIPEIKFRTFNAGEVPDEPGKISLHLILNKKPEEVEKIKDELICGNPSLWASSEQNHLVINMTSFRGLMLSEERDLEIIVGLVKRVLK